jgi:hypothetical protein
MTSHYPINLKLQKYGIASAVFAGDKVYNCQECYKLQMLSLSVKVIEALYEGRII